jgi:hypothetical protein
MLDGESDSVHGHTQLVCHLELHCGGWACALASIRATTSSSSRLMLQSSVKMSYVPKVVTNCPDQQRTSSNESELIRQSHNLLCSHSEIRNLIN